MGFELAKARCRGHTERESPSAGSLHFYGSVVAGQIAAGDIANYVNFCQLLDRAESEIKSLADVTDSDRDGALGLIEVLRGKASLAGAQVLTGAGGGLLAGVLAQLLGLPQIGGLGCGTRRFGLGVARLGDSA
jgi:hypothetical protein